MAVRVKKKVKKRKKPIVVKKQQGGVNYNAYIKSKRWSATKRRYWNSKLPKCCYICEIEDGQMDLHHRTYKNLGHERLTDLVPVHRECHQFIHNFHNSRKNPKQTLWVSTKKARDLYRSTGCL